jgi:hypothetical protein
MQEQELGPREEISSLFLDTYNLVFYDVILRGCLFSLPKFFIPTHRIFGHMHGVLNVDEKITNYTDCDKFARQFFKPN